MNGSSLSQPTCAWVILTMGNRPAELAAAIDSIRRHADPMTDIVLVNNGGGPLAEPDGVRTITFDSNLGVPEARDRAARTTTADVVAFLDDDAELLGDVQSVALAEFARRPDLGAVSFRLVDAVGATARRHVPRPGRSSASRSGSVVGFLGGACAVRREAYEQAGGYWGVLRYGHEELDLSWRLIERGWSIDYLADAQVFHPASPISRHADGWRLTGRNRVLIARRNLPMPVMLTHTLAWLVVGVWRAGRAGCGRAYLGGWVDGWKRSVERHPIGWATIWRLTRLGRPPVL